MIRAYPVTLVTVASLVAGIPAADGGSLTSQVGGVRVEVTSTPSRPATRNETAYVVRLVEEAGAPVTNARVTLRGTMADGMSVVAPLRASGEPGTYRGRVLFTMEGRWDLTFRVVREAQQFELQLTEHVAR